MNILILITIVYSLEMTYVQSSIKQQINITEDNSLFRLPIFQYGDILSTSKNDLCAIEGQQVITTHIARILIDSSPRVKLILDEMTYEQLYYNQDHHFSAMATSPFGVAVVTNTGSVSIIEVQYPPVTTEILDISTIFPMLGIQHLIYHQQKFWYFQADQALQFTVTGTATQVAFKPEVTISKIRAKQNILYCAAGSQGVLRYQIGSIELNKLSSIDSNTLYNNDLQIDIIDIETDDNHIYILDKNRGITIFQDEAKDKLFIESRDAKSISINNGTLIIIIQTSTQTRVIELYIKDQEFMLMTVTIQQTRFQAKAQFQRAFQNSNFAIISGFEQQYLQFTKEPNQARPNQLLSFGHSVDFQFRDQHLVQMQRNVINIYRYEIQDSALVCNFDVPSGLYRVEMNFNSTNCPRKSTDFLVQCQNSLQLIFSVERALFDSTQQQHLEIVAIVLLVAIGLLALGLFYLWRRFYKKNEILDIEKAKRAKSIKNKPNDGIFTEVSQK